MGLRAAIERLPPYPSLLLLGVPWLAIESIKLVALVVAGEGHWLSGAAFYVCAYAAGAVGTERLFVIVKPKLVKLPWFARAWARLIGVYARTRNWLFKCIVSSRAKRVVRDAPGRGRTP